MDTCVIEKDAAAARRPAWVLPAAMVVLLLIVWALAGCFMDDEDELKAVVPWLVVLGGSVAEERLELACELFWQGHGHRGVVHTGAGARRIVSERTMLISRCGIASTLIQHWPHPTNTFEEMSAVASMLSTQPDAQAIVVSNPLHMPRLRYIRDRLALNGRVYFREARLRGPWTPAYLLKAVMYWFREPLAYLYYRFRH